ncbi:MAG: bifunctional transaldolase/phosoglucose isomerase [Acidobacteria bacterium]|nr:bifunctional transaldolase/phosoglucose isomerase [Acidobacteriota bacterium]
MLNSYSFSLPSELDAAVRAAIVDWTNDARVARIWAKDAAVWTNSDESNWLGWLDIVERELADTAKYVEFAADAAKFDDIVVLGMGGSSLCPEVLSITFGTSNFHVLDSTVPAQVASLDRQLDLSKTLFIVASKSGSTLEPNCFKQYFYERVCETVGAENAGSHFVAITDPGSKMEVVAKRDGFRRIFYGEPQIGGRFSALSVFGLTAASALGIDVREFLTNANEMVEACRDENAQTNPGAALGIALGVAHGQGRDKLLLIASPSKKSVGAWLEQLVAESLGKNGVSIIPIDRKSSVDSIIYGDDRIFVYFRSKQSYDPTQDNLVEEIKRNGQAVITIESEGRMNLGQEFFRWEFATAVAGALMGINPFDQPDVESAKIEARKITEAYEASGSLPDETPFFEADGIKLFSNAENVAELDGLIEERSVKSYLKAHFERCGPGDYLALLAYLEMDFGNFVDLEKLRHEILNRYRVATSMQFGPRFLHSTGQAFKGGANNGVFLQVTSDDAVDLPVPGQKYTFGVVKAAQARGDFQVLLDRGRRALRIHFGADVRAGLKTLHEAVEG